MPGERVGFDDQLRVRGAHLIQGDAKGFGVPQRVVEVDRSAASQVVRNHAG